jgi:hypothetical protein
VTSPYRKPEPRTPQPSRSFVPHPQPSQEDLLELREPYDLPVPEYPDPCWLPRRPEFVAVISQLPGQRPDQPLSLAELLETGPARTQDREADLEAEP